MSLIIFLTYLLFGVWAARNILFWLFLWQVKEYRIDRMFVHIKETNQGRLLFTHFGNTTKFIIILLYLFAFPISDDNILALIFLLTFLVYMYDAFVVFNEILHRRLRKPVFTFKTTIIAFLVSGITVTFFFFFREVLILPLFDKLITVLIAFFIGIFSIPSRIYQRILINKAKAKMLLYPHTKVIAIIGCFGKGSTKEYLYTVLSKKFKVVKTFETQNTPIGIARTILESITDKTQFFIVEVGAYKLGETKEIAQLVRPRIGIITPVEDQHLSLFGSMKALKKGVFELIDELPPALSTVIYDGNSAHTVEIFDKTDKKRISKILTYTQTDKKNPPNADMIAKNVIVKKTSITFDVYLNKKRLGQFKTHLLGGHTIENILPAIFLGFENGMLVTQIKKALLEIKPWKKTLEPFLGNNNAVLIDDTFNSSPGATVAALRYMDIYEGKRILVLQPFVELGVHAKTDHESIGFTIGMICDVCFLTNNNYFEDIKKGILKSGGKCQIQIADPDEINHYIQTNTGSGDIIVFEGKEASISFLRLKKSKLSYD